MKAILRVGFAAAALLGLLGIGGFARAAGQSAVPPAWRTDGAGERDDTGGRPRTTRHKEQSRRLRSWYEPRFALGMGFNVPELTPFEGFVTFGTWWGLRLFYTPPLPFNIRIEMPSDVLSTKNGVAVANPDFTIKMKAVYGPQYGFELLGFPLGGSFFMGAGASYRQMTVHGSAKSPVLICSVIEAQKEPPCPDPKARLQTDTQLALDANVETDAILSRVVLGWFWHVGSAGYFSLATGATRPAQIHRDVKVTATVDSPGANDDINGALAEVKAEKERDLERKATKEMRPVDEKILPILGISAGVRF